MRRVYYLYDYILLLRRGETDRLHSSTIHPLIDDGTGLMGEGEASAPYVTCSQCARLRARKEFEPDSCDRTTRCAGHVGVEQNRAGAETKRSSNEQPVGLLIILGPVAIGFGIAICGGVFWFGLLFVIPGLLYRYSGPFKWTFDAIRPFLHGNLSDRRAPRTKMKVVCLSLETWGLFKWPRVFRRPDSPSGALHQVPNRSTLRTNQKLQQRGAEMAGRTRRGIRVYLDISATPDAVSQAGFQRRQPGTARRAYEPTFQLETSKTVEPSLPQLQPNANDMRTCTKTR